MRFDVAVIGRHPDGLRRSRSQRAAMNPLDERNAGDRSEGLARKAGGGKAGRNHDDGIHERRYDPTALETFQSEQRSRFAAMTATQRRDAVRAVVVTLALFVTFAFFVSTYRFFQQKFFITTGAAEWIWVTDPMRKEQPVAAFFARDFQIPASAQYVRLNVAADPGYTVYFNGAVVGRSTFAPLKTIDSYDVTFLKKHGTNRLVIAVRSGKGSGGLLATVDFGPMSRNLIVTDGSWIVHRTWADGLLQRDLPFAQPVRTFGSPPIGRWNFPRRADKVAHTTAEREVSASSVVEVEGAIRETRIMSGVAVASLRREKARAYDFDHVNGNLVLTREGVAPEVVLVRFANAPEELPLEGSVVPMVFAAGERRMVDPAAREFRYAMVYGSEAVASVVSGQMFSSQ